MDMLFLDSDDLIFQNQYSTEQNIKLRPIATISNHFLIMCLIVIFHQLHQIGLMCLILHIDQRKKAGCIWQLLLTCSPEK